MAAAIHSSANGPLDQPCAMCYECIGAWQIIPTEMKDTEVNVK